MWQCSDKWWLMNLPFESRYDEPLSCIISIQKGRFLSYSLREKARFTVTFCHPKVWFVLTWEETSTWDADRRFTNKQCLKLSVVCEGLSMWQAELLVPTSSQQLTSNFWQLTSKKRAEPQLLVLRVQRSIIILWGHYLFFVDLAVVQSRVTLWHICYQTWMYLISCPFFLSHLFLSASPICLAGLDFLMKTYLSSSDFSLK